MFRFLLRLISYGLAGLFGLLSILAFIASGGRIRTIVVAATLLAITIFWIFFPQLVNRLRALAQARVRRDPEHSKTLRVLTFAVQVVGVLALAQPTLLWLPALISIVGLAFGHWYAYTHRTKPDRRVRFLSFVALHLVFFYMLVALSLGGPYPQAQIAMLAMATVSWEIFSRLNLYSCFGMSLTCIYVAATLSRDLSLGLFLLVFLGLLLAFLWQADSEDGVKDNPTILTTKPIAPATTTSPTLSYGQLAGRVGQLALRFAPAMLVGAALVFVLTPHFATSPLIPPITLRLPVKQRLSSQIVNPALPIVQIEGIVDPNAKSEYYSGFDSSLDLSYRGGLTDTIMMYVRSPAASYWRSHAYDYYDGRTWSLSDPSVSPVTAVGGRYLFNLIEPMPRTATFVQSFFIVQPLPNVIFMGGVPARLLFPAEILSRDSNDGLRAPEPLAVDTQYTVYSSPQNWSAEELRQTSRNYPTLQGGAYLEIPPSTPSRVFDLARKITADSPTVYDKVIALRDYLKANYTYDYFPPPQAPNTDSVDQFLFVDKRGVCEHYVSAMVIMLRSLGIPSRLAAGYGSGTYNAITGYYEVHANDAHAWAEVYFPYYGWVPFDPTPGWTGNPQTGPVQTWIFSSVTDQLDLPKLPVDQLASAGATALAGAARPLLAVLATAFLALALWIVWKLWKDFRRGKRLRPLALHDHPNRRRILATYRQAQRTLKAPRAPAQTAQEQAALQTQLADLAHTVDVAAYRPEPPDEATVQRAKNWNRKP